MQNFRISAILIILLFYVINVNCQSGWARQDGSYFFKMDGAYFSSTDYRTPSGIALKTSKFKQQSLNLYGEYGLTDNWGIVASLPLMRINSFETTEKVFGLGDTRIDIKYNPFNFREYVFPFSLSAGVDIPTGRKNAYAKSRENPLDQINLPTGDGEINFLLTAALSLPMGNKIYASGFFQYNKRTKFDNKAFKDLYQIGFELGINPLNKLWINAKLRSQYATGNSNYPELGFVRGDATTFTVMSGELFYKLTDNWGISGTYFSGNDWLGKAKNLYLGNYVSVGITYELPYDFDRSKNN